MRESWSKRAGKTNFVPELVNPLIKRAIVLAREEGLGPNDLVLNVGSGNGEIDTALRESGFKAVGLDIVKHPGVDEEHFKEGSAEQLPYEKGQVKLYVSV